MHKGRRFCRGELCSPEKKDNYFDVLTRYNFQTVKYNISVPRTLQR